ncbi:hypothetical protein NKH77_49360 [Streptomyces sp. M19]
MADLSLLELASTPAGLTDAEGSPGRPGSGCCPSRRSAPGSSTPPERPSHESGPLTERLAGAVADTAELLRAEDRDELAVLLPAVRERAAAEEIVLDEDRQLALAVHLLAFARRVRGGEHLDALDPALLDEVAPRWLTVARELIDTYCAPRGFAAGDTEVLLLALHFAAAEQLQERSRT